MDIFLNILLKKEDTIMKINIKYIIVGGILLVITLLVSKVFMAVNLVHFNKYNTSLASKSDAKPNQEFEKTGKSTYMVYCSSCHGANGKGNEGKAQDHTKRIAQKSVLDVINNGANNFTSIYQAGMPGGLVNEADAKEIAKYVANGLKGKKPKAWDTCASCHDDSGEGIAFIAPNIKTYTDDLVAMVLKNGKKGVIGTMPSFDGRLSDVQIKAIANHIRSLGK